MGALIRLGHRWTFLGSFVGLLGAACIAPLAAGQTYLYNQLQLVAGNGVNSVIGADLNGDGILDVVVSNANDGTISIFLGKSGGLFAPQGTYFVSGYPCGPTALVAQDFNRDGRLDLATTTSSYGSSDDVLVLLGNGDGTFQNPVGYSVGARSVGIVAAEFNGDGKLDLATANTDPSNASGSVSVLLGNGDGTFQSQVSASVGMGPAALVGGDFNGDGKPDLITANANGQSVSVLLNNGDGSFRRVDTSISSCAATPGALALGDFNKSTLLDAVVGGAFGLCYLQGNGDGTFQAPVSLSVPSGFVATALAAADFNHDGKLDLAAGTGESIPGPFWCSGGAVMAPFNLRSQAWCLGQTRCLLAILTATASWISPMRPPFHQTLTFCLEMEMVHSAVKSFPM